MTADRGLTRTPAPSPHATDVDIKDALLRSGYLLEYRVAKTLDRLGFAVSPNQAYPDPITGKGRELDVTAITAEGVSADFRNILFPMLLVECVNNTAPVAFFTRRPQAPTALLYGIPFLRIAVQNSHGARLAKTSRLAEHGKISPLLQRRDCLTVLHIRQEKEFTGLDGPPLRRPLHQLF